MKSIRILYTNHRGETAMRHILPMRLEFITNEWYRDEWCIIAEDVEKKTKRTFALRNIQSFSADKS